MSSVEITKYGNIEKAVEEGNRLAILAMVTKVTATAKALAPVDLGQLRNSIMGRVYRKDLGFNDGSGDSADRKITETAKENEGYVGSGILHAIYNEFGTRKLAAQPFLRPAIAIEANGTSVAATVKKYQNESVTKGMRKGPRVKKVFQ